MTDTHTHERHGSSSTSSDELKDTGFNMLLLATTSLLLLGLVNAGSIQQSNQYVDTVLFNVLPSQVKTRGQDPAKLPDFHTEFKDKVLFVTVNVNTDYKKGQLEGLSKISRARDCSATSLQQGEYRINCTLQLSDLKLQYEGTTKYGKIPSVDFKVKADLSKLYIAIEFASYNRGQSPYIRNFSITNSVEFKPDFSGLGPASSVLKGLTNTFIREVTSSVIVDINGSFRSAIDQAVRSTVIPV